MGFLFLVIQIPKALTLTFFLNLLSHLKFMAIGALTYLGLYKPPPEEDNSHHSDGFVLILDGSSPSFIPVPVHIVVAAIRKRLPVVPYGDFLRRLATDREEIEKGYCTICLECIDVRHEIRQLFNCHHVFHRECLDAWVDEGQVTCPLCRSMLLPPRQSWAKTGDLNGAGDHPIPTAVVYDAMLNHNLRGEGGS